MSTPTDYPSAELDDSPTAFDPTALPEDPYDAVALDDLREAFPVWFPSIHTPQGGARAARGGQRPPLDSDAENVGTPAPGPLDKWLIRWQEQQQENRFRKFRLRRGLQRFTSNGRTKACGWVPILPDGQVALRLSADGKPGLSGFAHCGKVWLCPVCSAKIEATRRQELEVLVHYMMSHGYSLAFGTYTLRHRRGQALDGLWKGLSKGWRSVRQARAVRRLRKAMGCVGVVKAVEVTHGSHGWHPHLHTMHVFEREVTKAELEALHRAEIAAWRASAKAEGLTAPLAKGQQLRLVDMLDPNAPLEVAGYMAKHSELADGRERWLAHRRSEGYIAPDKVKFELAGASTKRGRGKGSRTMMQLLADLVDHGDPDDYLLWHEYEVASKGKHSLDWPAGLKARVGLKDVSDQEIVEEVEGGKDVLTFQADDLFRPVSAVPAILSAASVGGVEAAREIADFYSIPYVDGDCGVSARIEARIEEARAEARNRRIEQEAFEKAYEAHAQALARWQSERDLAVARREAFYGHKSRLGEHAWRLNKAAVAKGSLIRFYVDEVPLDQEIEGVDAVWGRYRNALIGLKLPDGHEGLGHAVRFPGGGVADEARRHPEWFRSELVLEDLPELARAAGRPHPELGAGSDTEEG